jgi:hypothetical protein
MIRLATFIPFLIEMPQGHQSVLLLVVTFELPITFDTCGFKLGRYLFPLEVLPLKKNSITTHISGIRNEQNFTHIVGVAQQIHRCQLGLQLIHCILLPLSEMKLHICLFNKSVTVELESVKFFLCLR